MYMWRVELISSKIWDAIYQQLTSRDKLSLCWSRLTHYQSQNSDYILKQLVLVGQYWYLMSKIMPDKNSVLQGAYYVVSIDKIERNN